MCYWLNQVDALDIELCLKQMFTVKVTVYISQLILIQTED